MSLTRLSLDISTRHQYNIKVSYTISTRTMYDDYEIDYSVNNESYAFDLDEMCEHVMRDTHTQYNIQDAYDMDDEYTRDSCDYNELAYRHYA